MIISFSTNLFYKELYSPEFQMMFSLPNFCYFLGQHSVAKTSLVQKYWNNAVHCRCSNVVNSANVSEVLIFMLNVLKDTHFISIDLKR